MYPIQFKFHCACTLLILSSLIEHPDTWKAGLKSVIPLAVLFMFDLRAFRVIFYCIPLCIFSLLWFGDFMLWMLLLKCSWQCLKASWSCQEPTESMIWMTVSLGWYEYTAEIFFPFIYRSHLLPFMQNARATGHTGRKAYCKSAECKKSLLHLLKWHLRTSRRKQAPRNSLILGYL